MRVRIPSGSIETTPFSGQKPSLARKDKNSEVMDAKSAGFTQWCLLYVISIFAGRRRNASLFAGCLMLIMDWDVGIRDIFHVGSLIMHACQTDRKQKECNELACHRIILRRAFC